MRTTRRSRSIDWIPILGVAVFVTLYFVAASLYPGGTRTDPTTRGYGHLTNYWCDLLDRVSYSGLPNPGYRYARLATISLPLSLMAFWLRLPRLFPTPERLARLVAIAGCLSMAVATLVFTVWHDLVIRVAGALGFSAFLAAELALVRTRRHGLAAIGFVAFGLAFANFLMWQNGWLLAIMPAVQKAAYASFFVWTIACSSARAGGLQPAATGGET
jgi:hypothetical protein